MGNDQNQSVMPHASSHVNLRNKEVLQSQLYYKKIFSLLDEEDKERDGGGGGREI